MSGSSSDTITALIKAEQALDRIDNHETLCSERYREITGFQKDISNKLDDLKTSNFRQWLVVAGGVITLLLSVIGLLYSKVMGWI